MQPTGPSSRNGAPASSLEEVVGRVGHLLPAQGPISVFIHHNTLHAFEDDVFEDGVEHGARTLGCEPFLAESRYREGNRSRV